MRVMSPQRPKGLTELGSAIDTFGASGERFGKNHDESLAKTEDSRVHAAVTERYPGQTGTASTYEELRDKVKGLRSNCLAVNNGRRGALDPSGI